MKTVNIACVLFLVTMVNSKPADTYTDKFDTIDINEILENRRLLIPFIKCLLDQSKCSAEGKELKSHIQEAMENNCAKCTDAQKKWTRVVISHFIKNEPEYWKELSAKYDPQSKYVKKYDAELKSIKA
ncbi:allergen Tha p 1-like [Vanessa tameamea]|uniref:Allergen Tha p 1-like n=1 Tax=Vanessa tameamea TaxID=334116 RepID=A0A8B8IC93_VANTA|nr:ejaculatory bulb-specific protein 3-like [Vanessa tameamea]XP_026494674.1 ejaculatory bulb-specific protein 3-like [Vanessa tameamea]